MPETEEAEVDQTVQDGVQTLVEVRAKHISNAVDLLAGAALEDVEP